MNDPKPDDLTDRLERAVPAPSGREVDSALDRVHAQAAANARSRTRLVAAAAIAVAVLGGAALLTALRSEPADEVRAGQTGDPSTSGAPVTPTTPPTADDEWPEGWRAVTTLPTEPLASPEEIAEARLAILEVLGLSADPRAIPATTPVLLGSSNLIPAGGTNDAERISLNLRADGWELAQQITNDVGASVRARAVEITVGFRSFPTGAPTTERACPKVVELEVPEGTGGAPVLDARIELDSDTVPSGADLHGRVIASATLQPIEYTTGPSEVGLVVRRGTTEVVGVWEGAMPASAQLITFTDRETSLELVAGTARCGPEGPPGLVPGDYDLVWGRGPLDGREPITILARAPITVTG